MKKLAIIIGIWVVCAGTSALATPGIEFSPDAGTAGGWTYNGAGTLSFDQNIAVDSAMGSNYDPLVGSLVYIPTLTVGGIPDAPYSLKPLGSSVMTIRSPDDGTIYLKATLGKGDLVAVGTMGAAYTSFASDLTNVTVTDAGKALGSAVLSAIINSGTSTLDFEFSFQGASGTKYRSLNQMFAGGYMGGGGFSGAMSIPEPATIGLLSLGSLVLWRKRRA